MIIRYILIGLIFGLAYIVGLIITPINYFIKDWLRNTFPGVVWWFLNDTKPFNNKDIDFGDYGRFKRNFIGYYRQNAIRNSHYNLKLLLKPKQGDKRYVIGELKLLDLDWNFKVGKTKATYKIDGVKYFRLSLIKKLVCVFGYGLYFHYQIGADNHRFKYKFKLRLITTE